MLSDALHADVCKKESVVAMSGRSAGAWDAVNRLAERLETPIAKAGARLILTLVLVIVSYVALRLERVETKADNTDRRVLVMETSRPEVIASFNRRVDALEAQRKGDAEAQGKLQQDLTQALTSIAAIRDSVQRIERYIDAQRQPGR